MAIKRKCTGRFGNARKIHNSTGQKRPDEEKTHSKTIQTETTTPNEGAKITATTAGCVTITRLRQLHEEKIKSLTTSNDEDAMIEYVLSTYNLFDDLDIKSSGEKRDLLELYLQNYYPDLHKKEQQTTMHERKYNCSYCNGPIIVEISNGGGVCENCGIEAWTGLGDANMQNTSFNHKYTKKRVHLYSKIVHFKDYICLLCGTRNNYIDPKVYETLKAEAHPPLLITPTWVIAVLRKHKLAKVRKHAPRLAMEIGKHWIPVQITGFELYNVLKTFHKIEYNYSLITKPGVVKRKVFLSYPYTYYRICQHLGYLHLLRDCRLLKSLKLLQKQDLLWKLTCEKAGVEYKGNLDHLALYK